MIITTSIAEQLNRLPCDLQHRCRLNACLLEFIKPLNHKETVIRSLVRLFRYYYMNTKIRLQFLEFLNKYIRHNYAGYISSYKYMYLKALYIALISEYTIEEISKISIYTYYLDNANIYGIVDYEMFIKLIQMFAINNIKI